MERTISKLRYITYICTGTDTNTNNYECTMDQELKTKLIVGCMRCVFTHQMAALFWVTLVAFSFKSRSI